MQKWVLAGWLAGSLILGVSLAQAEESDTDQLLNLLIQKGVVTSDEAAGLRADAAIKKQEEKQPPIVGAGKDGFFIKSADGDFQLKFRGLVNLDARVFKETNDKSPGNDQFILRRARGYFEATLFRYYDIRVMQEYGQAKAELFDAYVDVNYFPEAKLRLGRFVSPVSLGFLQPDPDGNFVERSLVTNLLPFRDLGVQLSGDLAGGAVNYAVGVFNGSADGNNSDGDNNNNKEIDGRIFVQPFKSSEIEALEGFGIGISGTAGDVNSTAAATNLPVSLKTQSQEKFFSYRTAKTGVTPDLTNTVIAKGKRHRVSPQIYYSWQSLGLMAEYAINSTEVAYNGKEARINNSAWQVTASYYLTGEKNAFKGGVTPLNPWGAVEVAARYARLNLDNELFPTFADPTTSAKGVSEMSVGVNWYLTKTIRFMLDYGQATFKGGNINGTDRNDEKIVMSRWQLLF